MAFSASHAIYDSNFYCENEEKLCEFAQKPHIGCGEADWGSNCGDEAKVVRMNGELRDMIVNTLNTYRSKVATGAIKGGAFGTAARMATLTWNDDLAHLAERNARKCRQGHSPCRNTPEFKYVGECNGIQDGGAKYPNRVNTMKGFMKAWFQEYKQADGDDMKHVPLNFGYVKLSGLVLQ